MGTKNDEMILSLKAEIEAKKKSLSTEIKFLPVTNCNLELDGVRYNIHTLNKDSLLLLITKLSAMKTALQNVLPDETLIIGGYSAEQWLKDLVQKFKAQNTAKEKERLQKLEARLHDLLSVDTKVELEIEELKSLI